MLATMMYTKIDIKSALIGLLFGVLVTVLMAATSSPGQVGRYQVSGTQNQGLLVDTVTGQVWRAWFSSNGGTTDGSFFMPKIGKTQ
jgi:hypothetical protein